MLCSLRFLHMTRFLALFVVWLLYCFVSCVMLVSLFNLYLIYTTKVIKVKGYKLNKEKQFGVYFIYYNLTYIVLPGSKGYVYICLFVNIKTFGYGILRSQVWF